MQTDDFQPTFSCTFTTGGESAQHFWIIQSLCSYSQCAYISTDGHTTAIFTLSTSTSAVTSAIFYSSRTFKTTQPVHPAESESAQISGLARTSRTKPGPFKGHPNLPKIIKLHVYAQKQKSTPSNTYTSPQYKKNCVNECVNVKQIQINFHHKTKTKKKIPLKKNNPLRNQSKTTTTTQTKQNLKKNSPHPQKSKMWTQTHTSPPKKKDVA